MFSPYDLQRTSSENFVKSLPTGGKNVTWGIPLILLPYSIAWAFQMQFI